VIEMGALDLPHFLSRVDARKSDLRSVDEVMRSHGIPGHLRQEFHDYLAQFKARADDHASFQELDQRAAEFKAMTVFGDSGGDSGGSDWSRDRGERGRRRGRFWRR
jgi:hypothetical protein